MAFDFEAAALGVEASPARQPTSFLAHSSGAGSVDEFPDLPRASHSRHWQAEGETSVSAASGRTRAPEHLPGNRPLSAVKLEDAICEARGSRGRDVADRLGQELLDGRRKLDQGHAEKMMLEQKIEQVRQRLKSCHEDRHQVSLEVSRRQADVEHLFTTVDFGRHQIEDVEGELAALRTMHQALSEEDISTLQHRFGPLRTAGPAMAAAVAQSSEQRRVQPQNLKPLTDLAEKARRESRRKFELQARQELLLATQKQAEQDRAYARKELELARSALDSLREDRLHLGQQGADAIREATRLAQGAGLSPGIVQDLLASLGSPFQPREPFAPRDPGRQPRSHRDQTNPFSNSSNDGVAWWRAMSQKNLGGLDASGGGAGSVHWANFSGV